MNVTNKMVADRLIERGITNPTGFEIDETYGQLRDEVGNPQKGLSFRSRGVTMMSDTRIDKISEMVLEKANG